MERMVTDPQESRFKHIIQHILWPILRPLATSSYDSGLSHTVRACTTTLLAQFAALPDMLRAETGLKKLHAGFKEKRKRDLDFVQVLVSFWPPMSRGCLSALACLY